MKIVEDSEKHINEKDNKTGYTQLDWRIGKKQATENLEQLLKQKETIEQKLQEMENLSKEDANLANDYLQVKKDVESKIKTSEFYYRRTLERAIEEKRD